MLKIIKDKKGFTIDAIVLLICFIIFWIVGFIFYILFSFVGKLGVYDIGSSSESLSANYALLNYLRTPIEIKGDQMNVADLIILSVNKNNYDDIIKTTEEILGREDIYYSIVIYDEAKYDAVEKGEKFYWTPGSAGFKVEMHSSDDIVPYNEIILDGEDRAEMVIPNQNSEIPLIKIVFWYDKGKKLTEEEVKQRDLYQSGGGI